MTIGHFIWTDLSTFDMALARKTYAALFDWGFTKDSDYDFASDHAGEGDQVAAVFPMPSFLVKINMPSFWMSYVHVEDLDDKVAKARAHEGVIIEIEPQDFGKGNRIALVRDPSGAGLTMVEGGGITPPSDPVQPGHVLQRYHHLPDIEMIRSFYQDLFGWHFEKRRETPWHCYDILHPDGSLVAKVEEVPETVRGKFRYWVPCFAVGSMPETLASLQALGGEMATDLGDGRQILMDPQGAALMVQECESLAIPETPLTAQTEGRPVPWKAGLGLACIWLAVVLDAKLFWGVLFLMWSWPALRTGRVDFVEPVYRDLHPLFYWGLVGTWMGLSLWVMGEALGLLGAYSG
ncbi:VOC family protein [Pseudophaeobacter sp.]|uniref:VOC family protein n=1 Tax=Pseudophaeobacter sp. TaxID=1971739 RepID=UPI00329687F8